MTCAPSPHIMFRKLLETMDELRRSSIKALKESSRQQLHGLTTRQGASISQLKLMLEESPEGVSLKSLAKRMQMTIPATSLLVEFMVDKGFMERRPNPKDRRAVLITLSPHGQSLYEEIYARFHNEVNRRAMNLTKEELAALASIVEKMAS